MVKIKRAPCASRFGLILLAPLKLPKNIKNYTQIVSVSSHYAVFKGPKLLADRALGLVLCRESEVLPKMLPHHGCDKRYTEPSIGGNSLAPLVSLFMFTSRHGIPIKLDC